MKKIFSLIALAFLSVSAFAQTCVETDVNLTGTASITFTRYEHKNLTGVFSVAADKQVIFSQGNLQYQASTDTWRFAEHQYDRVGNYKAGNVYVGSTKCDNAQMSSTYDGWIDLFMWGASGWNSDGAGTYVYQPWTISGTYLPQNLTGSFADADWAWHNPIINGGITSAGPAANVWCVLERSEWDYLIAREKGGKLLYGFGSIHDGVSPVNGVFLLPDDWDWDSVDGESFETNWTSATDDNTYEANELTDLALWEKLENAGMVFLPTTGIRQDGETQVTAGNVTAIGSYYATTLSVTGKPVSVKMKSGSTLSTGAVDGNQTGNAVRPVYRLN